jgi:diguanylate cyclase (GGDEF)-like protein
MIDWPDSEVQMEVYDKLTGLYEYESFLTEVDKSLALESHEHYILIRFDIKNFKLVNDSFGRKTGDKLLCHVADMLRDKDIPGAVNCRMSGDRFVIFMPEKYEDEIVKLLLRTPLFADREKRYEVFIYMGIYRITDKKLPVSMMSDRANIALNTVKLNRFVRIAVYDDDMYQDIVKECELSTEVSGAIRNGEITIHLQPQIRADGTVMGAEVLVRWEHPEKGMLSPGEFLPIFEKNYKIVDIDRYVWELACMQLKKWNDMGMRDIYLSVNISPRDFESIDVYETLLSLVDKYGIDPEQLRIEITETTIMQNPEKQIELIGRLRLAKFYVEMDDFGSGYSSLGMLKDIHLDAIKLDMRFLSKGVDDTRGKKVLKMTINLIKELEMMAIAEGVETEDEMEYLKKIGCDVFQGFYFSRPVPVSEFERKYLGIKGLG